jgi:hypothetical protein
MLIRGNNYENAVNSEYFILDRQFMEPGNKEAGRPDMLGFFWSRAARSRNREVPLVVFELKYGLNSDIGTIDQQVNHYFAWLERYGKKSAADLEKILHQKLDLGLFAAQGKPRVDAMRELKINSDPGCAEIAIVLADYNPHSGKLKLEKLRALPFRDQIRIMHVGFGLWSVRAELLSDEQCQTTTA